MCLHLSFLSPVVPRLVSLVFQRINILPHLNHSLCAVLLCFSEISGFTLTCEKRLLLFNVTGIGASWPFTWILCWTFQVLYSWFSFCHILQNSHSLAIWELSTLRAQERRCCRCASFEVTGRGREGCFP